MSKINETNYPRRTQANYADTDMLVLQAAGGNTYTTRMKDMRDDYEATLAPAIEEAVGWVGSNLFEGVETTTIGGITATKQNDGKYLVTGRRTGTVFDLGHFLCKAGVSYKLSGCPTGGGSNSFWLGAYQLNSTDIYYALDFGSGATIPAFNADTEVWMGIRVPTGYVCPSNFIWSPMISRNGGAYTPYHPTVQEELWDGEVSEPKNVLPIKIISSNASLSYTISDAGLNIVKSSTISDYASLIIKVPAELSGNYYVSGCPSGGSNSTFDFYMWDFTTNARCKMWDGSTPVPFVISPGDYQVQIPSGHSVAYIIRFVSSYTTPAGGVTFKPMISVNGGAYSPYYTPLKDVVPTKFNNSNVAPTEDGAGASQAYSTGQYLIHGGELRKATTAIASGAAITDSNTDATTLAEILELNKNELVADIATLNGAHTFDISDATLDCVVNRFARRISIMFRGVTLLQQLSVAGALTIMTVETGYWGLISSLGIATVRKDNTYYRALISKSTTNTALLIVALEAIPAGAVITGYIEWPY